MAQVDFILTIEGLEGESHDSRHATNIDILSWSWQELQQGNRGGGGGGGKVSMNDFAFKMRTSTASPFLLFACASGQTFPRATLVCRKAGREQQEFLKYIMEDIFISSFNVAGGEVEMDDGNVIPIEMFKINFAKIKIEYRRQNPDGSLAGTIKKGWDVRMNRSV